MAIKLRYKIGSVVALLLGVFFWGYHVRKPKPVPGPLPANVTEIVSVKNGTVTIQTPLHTKTISGVREGTLTLMKDGTSKLDIRTYGFEHQVGMDGFINSDGGALGLDLRYFYYKQFDALIGLGYSPLNKRLDIWAGVGYTIHT